jgi:hypothetical protein
MDSPPLSPLTRFIRQSRKAISNTFHLIARTNAVARVSAPSSGQEANNRFSLGWRVGALPLARLSTLFRRQT